jgi:serine/threonine-protein kinase HipA
VTALPYPGLHPRKLRLAMKFAGSYRLMPLMPGRHTWEKLATELGLPVEELEARARHLIDSVPQAFAHAAADPQVAMLKSPLPARLTNAVAARARECTLTLA